MNARTILRQMIDTNENVIVYKARQMGVSTELISFAVDKAQGGKTVVMVSYSYGGQQSLMNLMDKICPLRFYKGSIIFTTSKRFDRDVLGHNIDIVIMDECAWFETNLNDFISQVESRFPSQIILASSKNKNNDQFVKLFTKTIKGKTNFKPLHLPWFVSFDAKKESIVASMMEVVSKEDFANEFLCPLYDGDDDENET